jgi:hypothetical protein
MLKETEKGMIQVAFEIVKVTRQRGDRMFGIMHPYDGRLLEWRDISPTGNHRVDTDIGADGTCLVESKALAELIVSKL